MVGLGLAVAGLLGVAGQAASAHGSALRAGAPELADLPGAIFLAATGTAFALYLVALLVVRRWRPRLAAICAIAVAVQLVGLIVLFITANHLFEGGLLDNKTPSAGVSSVRR